MTGEKMADNGKNIIVPYAMELAESYDDLKYDADESEEEQLGDIRLTSDHVKDYLRQIGKHTLLTAEEEVELSKAMEAGALAEERLLEEYDALSAEDRNDLEELVRTGKYAFERMTTANLRLVVSIAKRYTHRGLSLMDLIQQGNEGLIRAVHKFDYTTGNKFSTYGIWWIRQAITRSIAEKSSLIRIPASVSEMIKKAERVRSDFYTEQSRLPTDEEVAERLEIPMQKLADLALGTRTRSLISLNTPLGEDSDIEFGDIIADSNAAELDERLVNDELRRRVDELLGVLSIRERKVMELRWGIGGVRPKTLDEVSLYLGVTRAGIQQIQGRALAKLQAHAKHDLSIQQFYSELG